jgi:hypothetical protein
MKISFIFSFIFFSAFSLFAQNTLESRKGEPYLPEAGDWAIQIDAMPFFNYAGNLFNNQGSNTLNIRPLTNYPFSIAGKYFVTEQTAYRAKLMLNFARASKNNLVVQDNQPAPFDQNRKVTDSRTTTSSSVFLGAGLEKRRGKTRLQGFYGAEALLMYNGGVVNDYNYGNAFGSDNTIPNTTLDFDATFSAPASSRMIESRTGPSFGIGARGFIGAEYFIVPKFAIGVEYGIGLMYIYQGDGRNVSQEWDTVQGTVVRTISRRAGGNTLGINTDISGGALTLTMHF